MVERSAPNRGCRFKSGSGSSRAVCTASNSLFNSAGRTVVFVPCLGLGLWLQSAAPSQARPAQYTPSPGLLHWARFFLCFSYNTVVQYAFVWGRTPSLSQAELAQLLSVWELEVEEVSAGEVFSIFEFGDLDPTPLFRRLGGTVKVARLDHKLPAPEGKVQFGISLYGGGTAKEKKELEISLKEIIRAKGANSRFVRGQGLSLSSGTVTRERLLERGFEWCRFYARGVIGQAGNQWLEGQTVWVQPIEEWAARDQARPYRDPRVGMLPPKLARILVNLAVRAKPAASAGPVYDPLCGSGTILQETLVLGYEASGADKEPRMVEYTRSNLVWLRDLQKGLGEPVEVAVRGAEEPPGYSCEAIVTEGYLGPPLERMPSRQAQAELSVELSKLYEGLSEAARSVLSPGKRLIVCLPYFKQSGQFVRLEHVDDELFAGYTRLGSYDYRREQQIVGREVRVYERT